MTPEERMKKVKARAAGTERYQPCGVCMGHSPSWDGHDSGCRVSDMAFLINEVERLTHGVNHPYGGIDGCERCAASPAVEHHRTGPGRCACGYDAYEVGKSRFFPDYHAMFMHHLTAARNGGA